LILSASVGLYSSHRITEEELADVIRQAGGVLTPELVWFGRISHEWTHVWIDPIPCYDGVFDDEGIPFDEKDMVLLEQAKVLLGGEFQTWISIILSRTSGSQRLAVRFAHTCCQHWPCLVDNLQGGLFACQEIEQLYQEDGAFTQYGL
jgi:hypothetical protein